MNINKKLMNEAASNNTNDFYKYLYNIADLQVSKRNNIPKHEKEDYIQFALMKCLCHRKSFNINKGDAYSFFWKQISLAISYKQRSDKKHIVIPIEEEKIIDAIDKKYRDNEGYDIRDIIDIEEARLLYKAYKSYNKKNKIKAEKNKNGAIKVLRWMEEKNPGFLDSFNKLKPIFKDWLVREKGYVSI